MAPNFPILIQNFQPTDPRRSVNVNQDKHKITLMYIIVELLKTKVNRKILKQPKEKDPLPI